VKILKELAASQFLAYCQFVLKTFKVGVVLTSLSKILYRFYQESPEFLIVSKVEIFTYFPTKS
jgi:hypothetical protein